MEERFVTSSYPARLFITVFGIMVTDAYLAHKARFPHTQTYKEWCAAAAHAGMHNTIDEEAGASGCYADGTPEPDVDRRDDPLSPRLSSQREEHRLVRISSIVGWKGNNRQRCVVCHQTVGWCCVKCSSDTAIMPIHRAEPNDPRSGHCLRLHQRAPGEHCLVTCSLAKQAGARGRSRGRGRGRGRPHGS